MKYRTGRTCSRGDFAIQNIPVRTEFGREIQRAFAERVLVSNDFDYEGVELRTCVDGMTGEQYEVWVKAQEQEDISSAAFAPHSVQTFAIDLVEVAARPLDLSDDE